MRFAFVPFVVLAASMTLVSAQSPNIEVTRLPTNVNVLNWPETQAVVGTVAVSNLPAVQTVEGTVNVGNLPLDENGSLKVTPNSAKQPLLMELVSQPVVIVPAAPWVVVGTVDTRGYSAVGVTFRDNNAASVGIQTTWRFADDEPFSQALDYRYNSNQPGNGCAMNMMADGSRLVCPILGAQMQIELMWGSVGTTVTSLRVYLFP